MSEPAALAPEAPIVRVLAIGERARRALSRSRGVAGPLAGFDGAPYFMAGEDIIWVGPSVPAMHPRVVLTDTPPPHGMAFRLAAVPSKGWSARLPPLRRDTIGDIPFRVEMLRRALLAAERPRGFGSLLAGNLPRFPLDLAVGRVEALAAAIECDDAGGALQPARALLGVGTGLTPSGDDLVGGALFGRRFIAAGDRRWGRLAKRLAHEIRTRSHAVSAALFADLAAGRSFAPLHAMADALATGDGTGALSAAQPLARIGHSSGWDMLAGFLIGICERARLSVRAVAQEKFGSDILRRPVLDDANPKFPVPLSS
ncbi:MAG: DUF2877 domain-containing protein [Betaproteobacteria bacterium]|nr:DUF2877 domain-containing protein [Betaproteobacteria bacterium]